MKVFVFITCIRTESLLFNFECAQFTAIFWMKVAMPHVSLVDCIAMEICECFAIRFKILFLPHLKHNAVSVFVYILHFSLCTLWCMNENTSGVPCWPKSSKLIVLLLVWSHLGKFVLSSLMCFMVKFNS